MSSNIIVIGGSRNIGYFSALRFLGECFALDTTRNACLTGRAIAKGSTVTFLLRSPSVFDKDTAIQEYVKSGKAHLVKGDCLNEADVQRVWSEAGSKGPIDLLLFTVGTYPHTPLASNLITL